jgi:hypothetical protein
VEKCGKHVEKCYSPVDKIPWIGERNPHLSKVVERPSFSAQVFHKLSQGEATADWAIPTFSSVSPVSTITTLFKIFFFRKGHPCAPTWKLKEQQDGDRMGIQSTQVPLHQGFQRIVR